MRKLSVLFLSLVVLFFFFAGFYLYYVPSNKASVDKYGFLILTQLETALQYKINADVELYSSNLEEAFNERQRGVGLAAIMDRFKGFGVDSLNQRWRQRPPKGRGLGREDSVNNMATDSNKVRGRLLDVNDGRFYYVFYKNKDTIEVTIPVSSLMDNLGKAFPGDFFSSFVFLKTDGQGALATLYKKPGVVDRDADRDR